ncbi:MAG: hypothetical protein ACKOQ1_09955, partial [Actinomycetota bacterium]
MTGDTTVRPTPEEFAALAAEHTVVPVWTEILADQLHERSDRRLEVGEDLGPHRHHRVLCRESGELLRGRSDRRVTGHESP